MKKILLSLFVALGATLTLSAETATLNTNSAASTWTSDGAAKPTYSTTLSGFAMSYSSGTTNAIAPSADHIRIYKDATFTISNTSGYSITSVVLNTTTAQYAVSMAPDAATGGTVTANTDAKTVTWTGNAKSVALKASTGQVRVSSIVVTYTAGAATDVATPTFTPGTGTFYKPVEVSIACATPNAVIKYTLNGGAEVTYTAPFTVAATTTVVATATDPAGVLKASTATATYTIAQIETVDNIAAFLAKNTTGTAGTVPYTITGDVKVTYLGSSTSGTSTNYYLFVTDASGSMQIFSAGTAFPQNYKNGDIISGITGTVGYYGKAPQMIPDLDSFAAPKSNVPVAPMAVNLEDITLSMLNAYVYIKDVNVVYTPAAGSTKESWKLSQNGTDLAIYNRFTSVVAPTTTGVHTVSGIVNAYNDVLQLFPTDYNFTSGVEGVEGDANAATITPNVGSINISTPAAVTAIVYNAAGQAIANKAITEGTSTIAVAPGFYIVKAGTTVAKVIVK